MEWPGIHIPQALLTLLIDDIPILCSFSDEEGNSHKKIFAFMTAIQPAKIWTSTPIPTIGSPS
jgi:hypothetical protein